MRTKECVACGVRMEQGFIADRGQGDRIKPDTWVEGKPDVSFWSGAKIKGKERFEITALRCPRCGRIELYEMKE
ncbi:MAG: PF20097 family protein [Gemmatimonadales bacterium]